jgi:hypothetical protein
VPNWSDPDIRMVLTLNNLAEKYGLLPSEAYARGTTLDLYVLDVSTKWFKYQQDIADGKVVEHSLTQDQMFEMLHKARSDK